MTRWEPRTWLRPRRVLAACGVAATALLLGMLAPSAPAPLGGVRQASASPFVTVSGGRFFLAGRPWAFTGYDDYRLVSASPGYQCGGVLSTAQLDQIFGDMARNSGSVVVRTWFFQSFGGPAKWSQYDRVLAAAAAHGIKIIPTLVNQWRQCEPDPGHLAYRNLSWYQSGYRQADPGYPTSFRTFAVDMARHYANDPTIAFWQLVNEAEAGASKYGSCNNSAAAAALRSFADDVTGAIKAVDRNHLVNLGTIGAGECGTKDGSYEYVNGGRTDICELHDYTHQIVMGDAWNGTAPDAAGCTRMGKPLFAGEVGINAAVLPNWSVASRVTPATLLTRSVFFAEKMRAFFNLGGQGFVIWDKSLQPSQDWWVGPGDPTERVMLGRQESLDAAGGAGSGGGTGGGTGGAPTGHGTPGGGAGGSGGSIPSNPSLSFSAIAARLGPALQLDVFGLGTRGWLVPRLR